MFNMVTQKKSKILTYTAIFEEAEEGGYFVYAPSLPGCLSEGDTFEEAKNNITEAIMAYLESLAKDEEEFDDDQKNIIVGRVEVPLSHVTM